MRQWWLANPTMKLDKSTKFGWFVKGKKKRDMGGTFGNISICGIFLMADIEDGSHVEWRNDEEALQ